MSVFDAPAPGLRDVTPFPAPSAQHPGDTCHDELRARFLRAGREAVDDRELLQLLLAGSHPPAEAAHLAGVLLDTFGSPARVLAARPGTLHTVAGLDDAGIAAIKTAEALGIAMARAALPERVHPQLATYEKVVEYCRTLAAHRDVEELHVLFLNTKNASSATRCTRGARSTTPQSIPVRSASARWRSAPPPWSSCTNTRRGTLAHRERTSR